MTHDNSVLNAKVSRFRDYKDTTPEDICLLDWLNDRSLKAKVSHIRTTEDKAKRDALKATLPAVTVGGTFSKRAKDSLTMYSGLMCIDIDAKDNQHIANYSDLKSVLSTAPFVAYCGLSVSGTGYFLVVPIQYPDKYEQHFEALRQLFERLGIVIDKSGKDVCRLRGYSYDVDPYFNHNAKKMRYTREKNKVVFRPALATPSTPATPEQTKMAVEKCINEITARQIDIAPHYPDWINVAFALVSEFAETGREYFHQVSQYYPEYDAERTDTKYSNCLTSNKQCVKIGTFFHYCKQAGVTAYGYGRDAAEAFKDCEAENEAQNN